MREGFEWGCAQLERLPSATPLPEERAAAEFMALDGLGAAAATALALTTCLGGRRHADLASLRACAQADAGVQLASFLLSRSCSPQDSHTHPAAGPCHVVTAPAQGTLWP